MFVHNLGADTTTAVLLRLADTTIVRVKKQICEHTGVLPEQQLLSHKGEYLCVGDTVAQHNLVDGSDIVMLVRDVPALPKLGLLWNSCTLPNSKMKLGKITTIVDKSGKKHKVIETLLPWTNNEQRGLLRMMRKIRTNETPTKGSGEFMHGMNVNGKNTLCFKPF